MISRVRGQMEESSKKRSLELRDFSFSVGRASHQGKVGQPSFSSSPRDQGFLAPIPGSTVLSSPTALESEIEL